MVFVKAQAKCCNFKYKFWLIGFCREHDGTIYDGEWKKGKEEGKGKKTWYLSNQLFIFNTIYLFIHLRPDNSEYDGEWNKGIPNGQGELVE